MAVQKKYNLGVYLVPRVGLFAASPRGAETDATAGFPLQSLTQKNRRALSNTKNIIYQAIKTFK